MSRQPGTRSTRSHHVDTDAEHIDPIFESGEYDPDHGYEGVEGQHPPTASASSSKGPKLRLKLNRPGSSHGPAASESESESRHQEEDHYHANDDEAGEEEDNMDHPTTRRLRNRNVSGASDGSGSTVSGGLEGRGRRSSNGSARGTGRSGDYELDHVGVNGNGNSTRRRSSRNHSGLIKNEHVHESGDVNGMFDDHDPDQNGDRERDQHSRKPRQARGEGGGEEAEAATISSGRPKRAAAASNRVGQYQDGYQEGDDEDEFEDEDEDAPGEDDVDMEDGAGNEVEEDEDEEEHTMQTSRGRPTRKKNYVEDSNSDDAFEAASIPNDTRRTRRNATDRRSSGAGSRQAAITDEDEDERIGIRRSTRATRNKLAALAQGKSRESESHASPRKSHKKRRPSDGDWEAEEEEFADSEEEEADEEDLQLNDADSEEEVEETPKKRNLRTRAGKLPNYNLAMMAEESYTGGPGGGASGGGASKSRPKNAASRAVDQYGGFMMDMTRGMGAVDPTANFSNLPDSDSDEDVPGFVSDLRKEAATVLELAAGGPKKGKEAQGGPHTATVAAGTVGRYDPEAAKADADPLGVDLDVTFDQVGGLDDHINQLKEMVALPLSYPELFQNFGITPPRGVLFHGPPGTGKTLLARALAASCSSENRKIAFFMRKGADCLSKWVGEAERQLRLLFEEAKNAQPSIIFFDEIDGLAPVRSAKQDQIHSSLVATLLALMDGMDGRGQVVVIGATNRPDNVDPALRRPGRFDREFYFPLPNIEARKKIIQINTAKWNPQLEEPFVNQLATLTKGYGGADLRALCTEAALNAIQRRYPQVYKTSDRLLLDPSTIKVQARDFMHSVKKIVPSSARSAASSAAPLPSRLVPLLQEPFEHVKAITHEIIPDRKRTTVLEEAEWEHDEDDVTFEREMMVESLEKLRIYRPRLVIHGHKGMGQRFIGAALLHHLEGYHVQNLDIASLFGQNNGSIEQAMVQMFVEAKRHQPSILYIPALIEWSLVLTETAKATFAALLDSLTPEEPVMVVALVDGDLDGIPADVRSWFGYSGDNFIELHLPNVNHRAAFFQELLAGIHRPPQDYPDGQPRRKRVLEVLPTAPPLPPKPPTEAQIAQQKAKDETLREILAYRLGPILAELKKKHRKAMISARDCFLIYEHKKLEAEALDAAETAARDAPLVPDEDGPHSQDQIAPASADASVPNGSTSEATVPAAAATAPGSAPAPAVLPPITRHVDALVKPLYVDFDLMQNKLIDPEQGYLELRTFIRDCERMYENVLQVEAGAADSDRRNKAHQFVLDAVLMVKDHFQDEQQKLDFERMAAREYARRAKEKAEREAKEAKDKPKPGSRHSNRQSGKGPELVLADVSEIEREGRKRSRESGASDESQENRQKRQRSLQVQVNGDSQASPSAMSHTGAHADVNANAVAVAGPSNHVRETPPPPNLQPINGQSGHPHSPGPPHLPPSQHSKAMVHHSPLVQSQPPPAPILPTKPPSPPPPPLFIPREIENLARLLIEETEEHTVEELEQLRAMCLSCIWKYRRDWNKTGLVMEMTRVAEKFIMQVRNELAAKDAHAHAQAQQLGLIR